VVGHSCVDCLLSMRIPETTHGKITIHYSRFCAAAFCYVHKCDVKLHPHRVRLYISNMVCGIWLGVGGGASVLVGRSIGWPVVAFVWLRCFTVHCVTLLSYGVRCCAILGRLSWFSSPAVGANWLFGVDVPLNDQPTNFKQPKRTYQQYVDATYL